MKWRDLPVGAVARWLPDSVRFRRVSGELVVSAYDGAPCVEVEYLDAVPMAVIDGEIRGGIAVGDRGLIAADDECRPVVIAGKSAPLDVETLLMAHPDAAPLDLLRLRDEATSRGDVELAVNLSRAAVKRALVGAERGAA